MTPKKTSAKPAETKSVSAKAATTPSPQLHKRVYVKAKKDTLCVAGRGGKQLGGKHLINAVQYHLKKAPEHIRQAHAKQVKYGTGMTNEERKEFIEHLISNDRSNEYFERFTTTEHSAKDGETSTWVSWKKLTTLEDEAAAKTMIKNGTIEHRPDPKPDHSSEDAQGLDWLARHQCKNCEQREDWSWGCG